MNKVPMTIKGAEALRDEVHKLKQEDRQKVIEDIAEARAHGDLKENAEYHAAREQQGFIEGRIREIEGKLSNAQIEDKAESTKQFKTQINAIKSFSELADRSLNKISGSEENWFLKTFMKFMK